MEVSRVLVYGLALLLASGGCAAVANTATGSRIGSTDPAPSDCVSVGGPTDDIRMSVVSCEGALHRVDAVKAWPGEDAIRLGTETLACNAQQDVIVSKEYRANGSETGAPQLYYCVSTLPGSGSTTAAGPGSLAVAATPRPTPTPFALPLLPTPPVWLFGDPSLTERELDACRTGHRLDLGILDITHELLRIAVADFSGGVQQVRRAGTRLQSHGKHIVESVNVIERSGLDVPNLRPIRLYGQALVRLGAVARKASSPSSRALDRASNVVGRREKGFNSRMRKLKASLNELECGFLY